MKVHVHVCGRWGGYSAAAQLLLYPRLTGGGIIWGERETGRQREHEAGALLLLGSHCREPRVCQVVFIG